MAISSTKFVRFVEYLEKIMNLKNLLDNCLIELDKLLQNQAKLIGCH